MPASTKTARPKPEDIPLPPEWETRDAINDLAEAGLVTVSDGEIGEDTIITAVVPADIPPTHHLVVGMGTLAAMSEEEFNSKLETMQRGQERIRIIQDKLLKAGEDYGRVKGIDRPFLHQPGAEKLANFYGFAVEQIAERIPGDGVIAPPISYHVRSLVHLGDFSGPVIAQGYGESSSWEEKYRYRWATMTCPKCSHELIRRKSPPELEGKYQCPAWGGKGGCGSVFDPNDPTLPKAGKIENPDPWSMAETLLQMAAKRSLVAGVRRATGTSGLFTQDEDSPSVRQSAGSDEPESVPPTVEAGPIGITVGGVGAKSNEATQLQHDRFRKVAKEKGLGGVKVAALLERLFNMEVAPNGVAASAAVKTLNGDQMGKLLQAMETGEVPEATPGEPPQQADEM